MKVPTQNLQRGGGELVFTGNITGTHRSAASASRRAFTRVELLVILAVLLLLALIVLPALANNQALSARAICADNLRQIGGALQLWGSDHGGQPPWELDVEQGGTQHHPLAVNAWLHFAWLSNELNTARVLLCPSDTGRPADDFTLSPEGGYLHSNFRNRSTSYFLSHAYSGGQFVMFAGDRNLQTLNAAAGCSRYPQVQIVITPNIPGWDANLHNQAGNLVRQDGRVDQYSNKELRSAVSSDPISEPDRTIHVLKPR